MIDADAGNFYSVAQTEEGVYTLRHRQTGELLHGQVGPEREATELYLAWSGLLKRTEKAVVCDVGMGAGAQTLMLLSLVRDGRGPKEIDVHSFDLEKEGLRVLRENGDVFPQAAAAKEFLAAAAASDFYEEHWGDRVFRWWFHGGDFCETFPKWNVPGVTDIFYDFFSSQKFPQLWTVALFEHMLSLCDSRGAHFVTYSTATCVRAALLAAGWYVGIGPLSGMRTPCIVASNCEHLVHQPLGGEWLKLFQRSGRPFTSAENLERWAEFQWRVRSHPQFMQPAEAARFPGSHLPSEIAAYSHFKS